MNGDSYSIYKGIQTNFVNTTTIVLLTVVRKKNICMKGRKGLNVA